VRSALVFLVFFGLIPVALMHPWVAPLIYVGMSVLNPHKLSYGAATDFPFAQVAAVVSLALVMISGKRRMPPNHHLTYLLLALMAWMSITALNSINPPERVNNQWLVVAKTQLMLWASIALIFEKRAINFYVYVLVGSIAFYGFKGGIFTILTGGQHHVWGAPTSVIEGNNELGLAIVMIAPLLAYIFTQTHSFSARMAIMAVGLFSAVSVLGTQSRGAAVALVCMSIMLALRSKRPMLLFGLAAVVGLISLIIMPESWVQRMTTIRDFEGDASAMSRLDTWSMIVRVALDHPFMGAGFILDNDDLYLRYNSNFKVGDIPFGPHSIFFQALGEHGFTGLFIYVGLLFSTWLTAGRLAKRFRAIPDHGWSEQLCLMLQVSLLGFCAGGAFLGLMHWDFPFYMIALVIVMQRYCDSFGVEPENKKQRETAIGRRYSRG
jgi:putative inorganic carbon (hco3(-)) transporter